MEETDSEEGWDIGLIVVFIMNRVSFYATALYCVKRFRKVPSHSACASQRLKPRQKNGDKSMPSLSSRATQIASKLRVSVFALAACAGLAGAVHAQSAYPAKPIRLIVPFPPGGGTDMIARAVAQKVADQNKWTVIVDNRPGAGGNLGVDAASKSEPDGYTLVMGQTSNLAINPTLYKKLPYDPLKDLVPVALVSSSPIVMAVPVNSRFKTFADVVAASKGKPDALTLGYSGNGTVAHLAGELA